MVLSGLPTNGWRPAASYSLTLTLSAGSRFGFEMTAEKSNASKAGSWTSSGNNQVLSTNWIGHSNANTNVNQWSFSWTAPSSGGQGVITFYAAGNAANNNGSEGGDTIHLNSWAIAEAPNINSLSPNFGTPGEIFAISGAAFGSAGSTVSFHDTQASWTSWSDTKTTATAPSLSELGTGVFAVNVSIVNATGTSTAAIFHYINSSPTITSVTPSSGAKNATLEISSIAGSHFSPSATLQLTKIGQSSITATGVSITTHSKVSAASFNLTNAATGFWNMTVTNPNGASFTLNDALEVYIPPPAAPSNVTATVLSSDSIKWSWNDNATDEDGYRVYAATGGKISADLAANITSFTWTNLLENTSYQVFVKAFNAVGESPASSSASASTPLSANTFTNDNTAATLTANDSKTQVTLSAGSLGGSGSILISLDPANKPLAVNPEGITAANNKLSGNLTQPAGSLREFLAVVAAAHKTDNFGAAVTISIPFADSDDNGIVDGTNAPADNLTIYSLDETAKTWTALSGSNVDKTAKKVSAPTNHFSVFTLIAAQSSTTSGAVKVFPNPFYPGRFGAGIRFSNLPSAAVTIRIYTLSGELVAALEKNASEGTEKLWNGKNTSGQALASGIYFALIESPERERAIVKLAIQR